MVGKVADAAGINGGLPYYLSDFSFGTAVDKTYGRLYSTGFDKRGYDHYISSDLYAAWNAGGLRIYDIGTDTVTTVSLIWNGAPAGRSHGSNLLYYRLVVNVLNNQLLIPVKDASDTNLIFSVPRSQSLIGLTSTLVNFSVRVGSDNPNGYPIISQASPIISIGTSEIWTITAQGSDNAFDVNYIGIYPSTAPDGINYTLKTTINVTSYVAASPSTYRWGGYGYYNYGRSIYYDSSTDRFYLTDLGSNNLIVIKGSTRAILGYYNFKDSDFFTGTGPQGAGTYCFSASFVVNELTGDLLISGNYSRYVDPSSTEGAAVLKTFVINRNANLTNISGPGTLNVLSSTTYNTTFGQLIRTDSIRTLYGSSYTQPPNVGTSGTSTGFVTQYGKIT
jgi:hypothetical protein